MNKYERGLRRVAHGGLRRTAAAVTHRVVQRTGFGAESRRRLFLDSNLSTEAAAGFIRHGFLHEDASGTAQRAQSMYPDAVAATLRAADNACSKRFRFLGRTVEFSGEIDWFWCPETGGSWPPLRRGRDEKAHFGADRPGDIKYPWELNRHQYFLTLGRAYRYTRDDRYAEAIVRDITSWRAANPYLDGHNWLSALEISIRLLSWMGALWLCGDSPRFRSDVCMEGLYEHAQALDRKLTTYWLLQNNHLIGEAAGLYCFATAFPHLPGCAVWRRRSLSVLAQAYREQVFPDGVNAEQATGYHRFILEFLLLAVRTGDRFKGAVPEILRQRLAAMLRYAATLSGGGRRVPQIGDCDDGRAFLLSESTEFSDLRGILGIGSAMTGDASSSSSAQGNDETLWFFGRSAAVPVRATAGAEDKPSAVHFPSGGHCMLVGAGWRIFVRSGPFGLGGAGASLHSHGDLLAPTLDLFGEPFAVDSGTYGYLCATAERMAFRSAAYHNTLTPAGVDQGENEGVWNWGRIPAARVIEAVSDASGSRFTGTLRSPMGYRQVRRIVVSAPDGELTICDELRMARGEAVEWRMHFAPGLRANAAAGEVNISRAGTPIARLSYNGYDQARIEDGWHSATYGERVRVDRLVLTGRWPGGGRGLVTIQPLVSGEERV